MAEFALEMMLTAMCMGIVILLCVLAVFLIKLVIDFFKD